MKKRSYIITALLAVSMLAAGCSSSAETIVSGSGTESGSGRLNVDSQRSEDTEELETAGVTTKQLAGEVKQKYASEEKYEYAEPLLDIPRDQSFQFTIGFDPGEKGMTSFGEIIKIYEESDLTHTLPYMASWDEGSENTFTIRPPRNGGLQVSSYDMEDAPGYDSESSYLFDRGEGMDWGNRGTLYMVQMVDLETGEPLEKPVVTVMTVKGELDAPDVTFDQTDDGVARFQWEPVEGAEQYYIMEMSRSETGSFIPGTVVGTSADTSWTAPAEDNWGDVYAANTRFRTFSISEDDWLNQHMVEAYKDQYDPADGPVRENSEYINYYGVVAVNQQGTSMVSQIFCEDDLAKLLPYNLAYNTERGSEDGYSAYTATLDTAPAYRWITLCDGRLSQRLIHYKTDEASEADATYAEMDDDGNIISAEDRNVLEIPYVVDGTPFSGSVKVENYKKGTWKKDIQGLAERQEKLRSKTGNVTAEIEQDEEDEDSSEAEMKVKDGYQVTANSALSEYLAISMLNGVRKIDLSEFPESSDTVILTDAWEEAYYQNPLILGIDGIYLSRDGKSLKVKYQEGGEERRRKQQEIIDQVETVTSRIISSGMSDLEKELAINNYLCENGTYDYDALDNAEQYGYQRVDPEYNDAFTPYGILIDGKGVCASYAGSFKLLADAAGLKSIVTTGYLDGSLSHAWNRVEISGAWQTVDVTNNDNDMLSNALLNMPDYAVAKTLIEDTSYVIDSRLGDYRSDLEKDEYYHLQNRFFSIDDIADELTAELEKNGTAVLRTNYDLDDNDFYEIGNQVIENTQDEDLKGFYWMGVIYLEK